VRNIESVKEDLVSWRYMVPRERSGANRCCVYVQTGSFISGALVLSDVIPE
jgi:hypothetical protein